MGTQLVFNPITGSLDLVRRQTVPMIAGATLSPGDALSVNSLGRAGLADATYAYGLWRIIGVAATAASSGTLVQVATLPTLIGVNFSAAPPASANGSQAFVGTTPGEATLTPIMTSGHVVFSIGVIQGANGISQRPAVLLQPQYITRVV